MTPGNMKRCTKPKKIETCSYLSPAAIDVMSGFQPAGTENKRSESIHLNKLKPTLPGSSKVHNQMLLSLNAFSIRKRHAQLLELHRVTPVHVVDAFAVDVVIKNVSLLRNETGFADLVAQVTLVCAGRGTGGRDNVFLDHYRTHVIGPEAKCRLAELQPLRKPRCLDVLDVVEKKARDSEHLEVIDAGRFFFDLSAKSGVLALKRPWNERRKSAGLVLYVANALEMPD